MNWVVYLAGLWLALGLDVALRQELQLGDSGAAPSLALILVTYVALWAPRVHALWAALVAGLALDVLTVQTAPGAGSGVTTLGPHALGAMMGAYAVGTLRATIERTNLIALPLMTLILMALTRLVVVFCYGIRQLYDPQVETEALRSLGSGLLAALYSAGVAIVLGLVLRLLTPLFGFHHPHGFAHRGRL